MKPLLVEDNAADARLIREMLKQSPAGAFQLEHVDRLDTALKRLRQEIFDVVLLDLGLPDSQGMETLTRIQAADGGLPIVVLTGMDDQRFALEILRAGAQDYLVKGRFDSDLLVRSIRYAVERKQVEDEVRRLNAELERRVAERTAQFQAANDELLKEVAERERAQEALRQLNESLEQRVAERTAETRQLADQLRALAAELSQAEQRERKRLATILHDHIQQLLVAAKMQLALVKRADPKTIHSTVQGIESILNDAVEASRSLTVELSPPILHQAGLAPALGWLASRLEENSLFKVHVQASSDAEPSDEPTRVLLFESVRELLLNAVKYSGIREARVTMARTEEGWIRIIVEDQGTGFDPNALKSRKSTGFGLFSIQQRLAYLGGRMEIESSPGRGTRVVLYAAAVEARKAEEAAVAAVVNGKLGAARLFKKHPKIAVLLVDDHRIVRQGLVSLLQFEPDMEVAGEAGNGREAVEMARQHGPDVVIMDVNMPVMNGIEATKIIVQEMPDTKVIGLSMHTDPDVIAAMRQAGAIGYLTKGGPSEDLLAAIRACVSPSLAANAAMTTSDATSVPGDGVHGAPSEEESSAAPAT